MSDLSVLEKGRPAILLAEVAALLHNLGKLGKEFIGWATKEPGYESFDYQGIAGIVSDLLDGRAYALGITHRQVVRRFGGRDAHGRRISQDREANTTAFLDVVIDKETHLTAKQWMRQPLIVLPAPLDPAVNDRPYCIGDFIAFQNLRWYRSTQATPAQWIHLFFPASRATALLEQAHHDASGGEKAKSYKWTMQQPFDPIFLASAFGWEGDPLNKDILKARRDELVRSLYHWTSQGLEVHYRDFYRLAEQVLLLALGDTQRPINDVTAWDLCSSAAALFKGALAKAILKGAWSDSATLFDGEWEYDYVYNKQKLPNPHPAKWQFIHLSFDGLGFLGQAHRVSDLLGRQKVLSDALNAAQAVLETKFPVGNEVYRDEHGSIFVVADRPDLLRLTDADGTTLKKHVQTAFDAVGLQGELQPEIVLSQSYPGQDLPLYQVIQGRARQRRPDLTAAQDWWPAEGQPAPEICTVCGLRPVGYGAPDREKHDAEYHDAARKPARGCQTCKTLRRKVCYTCHLRRGRRAQAWARNRKAKDEKVGPFERTIWINEVADANGRAALIVGRFDLRGWLDGKLVATLRKNPSFARIRRCWETTRRFWQKVQNETIPAKVKKVDWRLRIKVDNPKAVNADLGNYHVYQWPLRGGVTLSVVWDPKRECFISADNLAYLAGPGQLGLHKRPSADQLHLLYTINGVLQKQGSVFLQEPSGYGQPRSTAARAESPHPHVLDDSAYVPTIPLLAEPATFMALVPADKAMAVMGAIRDKYATEMGRVRDRLPLHLGLVVFPRRTPLCAALDAGQTLLNVIGDKDPLWEKWQVESLSPDPRNPNHPPADGRRTITFTNGVTWQAPLLMGDGKTPDQWYAHSLKVNPRVQGPIKLEHLVHASQLKKDDQIWVRPSTFDYIFLDTTGRRLEIAYNSDGRRLGYPTRPFDLETIHNFDAIWETLTSSEKPTRLKSNQLHALLELARTKIEDWGPGNEDSVNRLLKSALVRAAWPGGWKKVLPEDRERLLAVTKAGLLPDLLDLYSSILKVKPLKKEVETASE